MKGDVIHLFEIFYNDTLILCATHSSIISDREGEEINYRCFHGLEFFILSEFDAIKKLESNGRLKTIKLIRGRDKNLFKNAIIGFHFSIIISIVMFAFFWGQHEEKHQKIWQKIFFGFDRKYKTYIYVGINHDSGFKSSVDLTRFVDGEAIIYELITRDEYYSTKNNWFKPTEMFPRWMILSVNKTREFIFDEIVFEKQIYLKQWFKMAKKEQR